VRVPGETATAPDGGRAKRFSRTLDVVGLPRLAARLGVSARELACLGAIVLAAAVLRLVNLPARGGWDSDQGTEMLALRSALTTGHLPTFGPEAISVSSSFHHGALYYDLLLPAAWLGNGDPTWVVAEIALLSLIVVPVVWWIARSIGGTAAGLSAALLAAASGSLIGYATFIWNPTLVEPGAAIAFLGAWQALRTRRAAWWVVAAAGAAVAVQAHVAAAVIVLPLAMAFLVDLRRGPSLRRARVAAWGVAGVALFVATYLPLIVYELSHNFSDTRGMIAYFTEPNDASSTGPLLRLLFAAIRIFAWPLTRWPMVDLRPAFLVAFTTATAIMIGLFWRLGVTARRDPSEGVLAGPPVAPTGPPETAAGPPGPPAVIERFGVRLVGGWLLLIVLALGLGLHAVSEVQALPTEQYHVVADPLVLVAAGLILGGLWRALPQRRLTVLRRVAAVVTLGALLAWNVGHWPALTAPDGGWPAAQAAATKVEQYAGGTSIALVPLFEEKGSDAYLYPLTRDGFTLVAPDKATTVVLLCDVYWLGGCGGAAEANWVATNRAGRGLVMESQFRAAPDRILTVYRRRP
jgi:4-amino-4-deoxy-L-arabinose transferase-like glycosyltransferase